MAEPYTDKTLADSQRRIVEIFSECTTAEAIKAKVAESDIQADLKAWLSHCTPEMIETAAILVKKWGSVDKRDDQ